MIRDEFLNVRCYISFMLRDTAPSGSGDCREPGIALATSLVLHLAVFSLIWLDASRAGAGAAQLQGARSGTGVSADFLAPNEFRQRIESAALRVESVQSVPPEVKVKVDSDPPAAATSAMVDALDALPEDEKASEVKRNAPEAMDEVRKPGVEVAAAPVAVSSDVDVATDGDDGLRATYLAALAEAISEHWNYDGPGGSCSLGLQQLPGGKVQSAVSPECDLGIEAQRALEAAALMAQPLPYEGYESVFSGEVFLKMDVI